MSTFSEPEVVKVYF